MKKYIIFIIEWYQQSFSHDHKHNGSSFCKFTPSCSEYTKICFQKYSFFKALFKAGKRIISCNPFSKGGIDLP